MRSSSKSSQNPIGAELDQPKEKYSLRQKRSTRNTNKQTENSTKNDASNVLPSATEAQSTLTETSTATTTKSKNNKKSTGKSKSKQKAAPLSKYRRKTANARERIRMREINSAFEHLRQCVPVSICEGSPTNCNEKLTKITTLRLAMKYISTLNSILNSTPTEYDTDILLNNIINKSELSAHTNTNFINNNNDTMMLNNNNIETKTKKSHSISSTKGKRKSKKSETVTANKVVGKRRTAKTKSQSNTTILQKSNKMNAIVKKELLQNAMNTVCLTPPSSLNDSPIDLGLMLESDGESLHLSEPCLSPPLSTSQPNKMFNSTIVSPPSSMTTSNGLDIGLFFESDTDSLQFPEQCLSPLDGGFDPFSDLLHSGFAEHSSLDIYLT